jgi:hypothetical protein
MGPRNRMISVFQCRKRSRSSTHFAAGDAAVSSPSAPKGSWIGNGMANSGFVNGVSQGEHQPIRGRVEHEAGERRALVLTRSRAGTEVPLRLQIGRLLGAVRRANKRCEGRGFQAKATGRGRALRARCLRRSVLTCEVFPYRRTWSKKPLSPAKFCRDLGRPRAYSAIFVTVNSEELARSHVPYSDARRGAMMHWFRRLGGTSKSGLRPVTHMPRCRQAGGGVARAGIEASKVSAGTVCGGLVRVGVVR